jgi:Flp pilus assembly pilin Flp
MPIHTTRTADEPGARGPLRRGLDRLADDDGAATAEYAITTMAAVAFAGLLVAIMRSDEVRGILTDLVRRALSFNG